MKRFVLFLSIIILMGVLTLVLIYSIRKNKLRQLTSITGLLIPDNATNIEYEIKRANPDFTYPYSFFAKFSADQNDYLSMVTDVLINRLDTNNLKYRKSMGNILEKKEFFWGFDSKISNTTPRWWNIPIPIDLPLLFANVFNEEGYNKIGDINNYNGRIVTYYYKSNCYVYFECWPTSTQTKK